MVHRTINDAAGYGEPGNSNKWIISQSSIMVVIATVLPGNQVLPSC